MGRSFRCGITHPFVGTHGVLVRGESIGEYSSPQFTQKEVSGLANQHVMLVFLLNYPRRSGTVAAYFLPLVWRT